MCFTSLISVQKWFLLLHIYISTYILLEPWSTASTLTTKYVTRPSLRICLIWNKWQLSFDISQHGPVTMLKFRKLGTYVTISEYTFSWLSNLLEAIPLTFGEKETRIQTLRSFCWAWLIRTLLWLVSSSHGSFHQVG